MPDWYKRIFFISFLLFILLTSLVFAVPPVRETTVFTGVSGISIQAPTMPYMKIGTAGQLVIHCFNATSGKLLTPVNSDIECSAALMWPNGSHLLTIDTAEHHNDYYRISYSPQNITKEGLYGFIIHCNNSNIGGYLIDYFRATETGEADTTDTEEELLLYFVFALSIILLLIAFYKDDHNLAAISGMLQIILGGYIIVAGFSNFTNALSNAIGIIFISVGIYVFIRSSIENI